MCYNEQQNNDRFIFTMLSHNLAATNTDKKRRFIEENALLDKAKAELAAFNVNNYLGTCTEIKDLIASLVENDQGFQSHLKNLVYLASKSMISKCEFMTAVFPIQNTKSVLDLVLRIAVLKDNIHLLNELLGYTRELGIRLDLDMLDQSGKRAVDYFFIRYPKEIYGEYENSRFRVSRTPISIIKILLEAGANGNSFFDAVKNERLYIAKLDNDHGCNGCLEQWIMELRVKYYKFQASIPEIEPEEVQFPQLVTPPASTLSLCIYGGPEVHFDMSKLSSTAQIRVNEQFRAHISGEISPAALFASLAKEFASVGASQLPSH
jgi:hypothetical protein